MKYLKMVLLMLVAVFTFGAANAQVVLRARVGRPIHHRNWHHHRHYYWRNHHRYWR